MAVVTGASSGIGQAIVRALLAEGVSVVGHAHTQRAAAEALGIPVVVGDLRDPGVAEDLVGAALARFGRIDVVAANAGRWPEAELALDLTPIAELRTTLDDNLWTAMLTARALFGALRRAGPPPDGASLVFTGSTAGRFGEAGHTAYAVAKSALYGLVASLKNEIVAVDPNGRVNGVAPGWTVTPAVAHVVDGPLVARATRTMPLRRLAAPEDVARAVLYLASPTWSRHVTGEWLTVAGGMEGRVLWP